MRPSQVCPTRRVPSARAPGQRRPSPGRSAKRLRAVGLALCLSVLFSACDPLQLKSIEDTANLKYEPPARLAVMVKQGVSEFLWKKPDEEVRRLLVENGPRWDWRLAACTLLGAQLFCGYVQHIQQRFTSDARTRGDLREALNDAHDGHECFTWTFTLPNRSNYTWRSHRDDHCRP
jgi:hypothetical protein